MPKAKGILTNVLERRAVIHARRTAVQNLVDSGVDPLTAENHVSAVMDEDIKNHIAETKMKFGTLGDGGFIKWLQDHMDVIMQIVKFIMSVVAMFATKVPKTEKPKETA